MTPVELRGWDRLRHGGLLLDTSRLRLVAEAAPGVLPAWEERELRRLATAALSGSANAPEFVSFVLDKVCGFTGVNGTWQRGSQVGTEWGRRAVTGEVVKPRHLWCGQHGATLPVFVDTETRLGIGRGRKSASQTVQWLRAGRERLALLTNGRQWRLIFAGLDFDAWCEWDVDLWFEEGALSPQVHALRTLFSPKLWTPLAQDAPAPLLQAILDSRKGQAELSAVLGERVREAVELLVQGHGEVLKEQCASVDSADIYRAAVRVVMRMVVVLFAESRELLPRDNALYHGAYGLTGLLEDLEKIAARGGNRLARSWNAWPRVLSLFCLVHQGSHHPALPVPAYGGDLFALGNPESTDGLSRALSVFESATFDQEIQIFPDRDVHRLLERITRTKVKVRQGRASIWVPAPVDFSDLSSEYIGILYEGLLDFELKTAPAGDPVVFLSVGNQPALPLSRLEAMDDRALTNLLEKMKDTSTGDDEAGDGEGGESPEEEVAAIVSNGEPDEGEETTEEFDAEVQEEAEAGDERHVTRTRAENWAHRAVKVCRLVKRPRSAATPEKHLFYEDAVARKARQLVSKVVLPGEWYVVRWGGTRKGSGTFYTRPGLAVPTVHRTLRPLAYTPPTSPEGTPDIDAPPSAWIPRIPEEILALKVCDPACGSGTFPVAALRFLTEALFASLHHHGRVSADGERAVDRLLALPSAGAITPDEHLGQELLPCRPDDALFEPRMKAVLRRHVVERCIYGVELDPLAVELCRLALWIETMDRTLPFSFLDHKIKCGNSLVGAWFDQFQHYPVMAWKGRKGGDEGHSNGVHCVQEQRGKAIRAFVEEQIAPNLQRLLEGKTLFEENLGETAGSAHDQALATILQLHELPVQDSAERARIYREQFLSSPEYKELRSAMDLWSACWFWPANELEHAPLPADFAHVNEATQLIVQRVSAEQGFFHWELEFPDVFRREGDGFDAILGNPPWDTLQPNSKEYFSNIDPLYRSYGKQQALKIQRELFLDESLELAWLDYAAGFANYSNWMRLAQNPFGDPSLSEKPGERFRIARGAADQTLHQRWRAVRCRSKGFVSREHPFRFRGEGKAYSYKLFIELAYSLMREGGRMGFIVPSGLYSDDGTAALRRMLIDRCQLEWVFNFENREKIFEIDSRFKFNPIIAQRGGMTQVIRLAVNRRDIEDWSYAERYATNYERKQISSFSPKAGALLEVSSPRDLEILSGIFETCDLLAETNPEQWGIGYKQCDFNLTSASGLFRSAEAWAREGGEADDRGRWQLGGEFALPLYEGKMIWQYDFSFSGYDYGGSRRWRELDWTGKSICPRYLVPESQYVSSPGLKLVIRDVSSPSNRRTIIAACIPDVPCGHKTPILRDGTTAWKETLALSTVLNSLCFDYVSRLRFAPSGGGGSLVWSILGELPLWRTDEQRAFLVDILADVALQLLGDWTLFSPVVATRVSTWNLDLAPQPAISQRRRLELRCIADAINFYAYGLSLEDARWVLRDSDHPLSEIGLLGFQQRLGSKLFWRVDRDLHPECRHTVLSFVAYHDLQKRIAASNDPAMSIHEFARSPVNRWRLPECLTLRSYGLGHDDRATHPQPVGNMFPKEAELPADVGFDWLTCASRTAGRLYGESWKEHFDKTKHPNEGLGSLSPQGMLFEPASEAQLPKIRNVKRRAP